MTAHGDTPTRGLPITIELVEAVERFIREEAIPETEGRVRYLLQVSANVLAMVGRDLAYGPSGDAAHASRLLSLGMPDEAALAKAIRDRDLDDALPQVIAAVTATAIDRLRVVNPSWLTEEEG